MLNIQAIACVTAVFAAAGVSLAQNTSPSAQDKQFAKDAASGGMLEVRLGQYASDNASSDAVKKFGEKMVGDHTKANDKLKEVASQKSIEVPKVLSDEDQKVLDRLEQLKGADFDKAYVKQMIEDHLNDVHAFEKEVNDGTEPAVKAFAEATLPSLKHHLEMARALEGKAQ
jgi:putative membrane protein